MNLKSPSSRPKSIASEISRLSSLSIGELRSAWVSEFGHPPPKCLWRDLLLRALAWRLQEKALGGHERPALRLLSAGGQLRTGDQRYRRRKPGTVLVREFSGIRHTVTIAPEGFVWQDQTYPSLTAIARIITGTNWNGPRFFGLREERDRAADKPQREASA